MPSGISSAGSGSNNGTATTWTQAAVVRGHVNAAVAVLDWLQANDLTLTTCRQGDLETWLTSDTATHRSDAGHFLRWAKAQKLTRVEHAAIRWDGPAATLDSETRWNQTRWLLHDDTLNTEDRVAGLLVLLYAQWPATISRLTIDHVGTVDDQVSLHLGVVPIVLVEPLDALALELVARRRGHATLGDSGNSPWLFPGDQPDRPISAARLGERLRDLGLRSSQARSTALFSLAAELPAALLARLLGIHVSVAAAWQRASTGDWTGYAAEISRRSMEHR